MCALQLIVHAFGDAWEALTSIVNHRFNVDLIHSSIDTGASGIFRQTASDVDRFIRSLLDVVDVGMEVEFPVDNYAQVSEFINIFDMEAVDIIYGNVVCPLFVLSICRVGVDRQLIIGGP